MLNGPSCLLIRLHSIHYNRPPFLSIPKMHDPQKYFLGVVIASYSWYVLPKPPHHPVDNHSNPQSCADNQECRGRSKNNELPAQRDVATQRRVHCLIARMASGVGEGGVTTILQSSLMVMPLGMPLSMLTPLAYTLAPA